MTTTATSLPPTLPAVPAVRDVAPRPASAADDGLRRRGVRGGALTVAGQVAGTAVTLGTTAVLARLLVPADFGLVAMVAVVTGFVLLFKDLGLGNAAVQRADLTAGQASALFWINALVGLVLGALVASASPLLAWVYREERVLPVALAMSAVLPVAALGGQHAARLRRELRFKALAALDLGATAAGSVVAVVVAAFGGGVWSLVALTGVTAAGRSLGAAALTRWVPDRPSRRLLAGIRPLLSYGGNLTASNVVTHLVRNGDNFLIGLIWGPAALGLYAKAYGLLMMPVLRIVRPVGAVALPVLCRLQDEPERFDRYYRRATLTTAYLTMPLLAVLAAGAQDAVALALGPGWERAATIFRLLALAAVGQAVATTAGWVYQATGNTRRMAMWSAVSAAVMLSAFVAGVGWGPEGVAIGFAVALNVLIVPTLLVAAHRTPVRGGLLVASLAKPAAAAAVAGAAGFAAKWAVGARLDDLLPAPAAAGVTLLIVVATGVAAVGAVALLWPAVRRDLNDIASLRSDLRRAKAGKGAADAQ